jgi:replicative DNA helicase
VTDTDFRTLPHDIAAEQCVLGGMLLSKDAISDVIELIRPADHYRPAHQLVHETILDLYARGEPVDAITVANELSRRGEISRIGGGPYLHTLLSAVPTAANAGYYAKIVAEQARLRRLIDAGAYITQLGWTSDGTQVSDLETRAQERMYQLTTGDGPVPYQVMAELVPAALDELDAIALARASRDPGEGGGILTGFSDLDALTHGLHPGQLIVIGARPAVGKALALDTPLPALDGWTTMGAVDVGDKLLGAQGDPVAVVAATEVMHGRPCYEVAFSDGCVIVADAAHQWLVTDRCDGRRPGRIITTGQLASSAGPPAGARYAVGSAAVGWRYIQGVRRVPSRPVRCVQVDSDDHLYLAGPGMIPTHNSALALDFARAAAVGQGKPTAVFSLEMNRLEVVMRILSAAARVPLHAMRGGYLTDDDWLRLARRMSELLDAPLWVDDSPLQTLLDLRAKCRRLRQKHDLRLVIVDYLQLMTAVRPASSRQQDVSEMSRGLKLLAKELEVPVVALSQLNRGPEQRTDKKPMLADLRESGGVEQDADVVILLHREDAYDKESPRAGEADLIVAKHRNGPTAIVTTAFQGHYSRFVDMAPG